MASETFTIEGVEYRRFDIAVSAPGDTLPIKLAGDICVQIAGDATAIDATVLRSPDSSSNNFSPAGDALTGNPATGMTVRRYEEPTAGFWKIRVTSITGTAKIHLSGRQV